MSTVLDPVDAGDPADEGVADGNGAAASPDGIGSQDHPPDVQDQAAHTPTGWFRANLGENLLSLAVLVACCGFVFWICQPRWVFTNTTPTGGDMGAHVWGPAYLRDHLLPQGRIAGWTPDWYTGFPAYTFYMVVPSLAIVALAVGLLPWWSAFFVVPALAGLGRFAWLRVQHRVLRFVSVGGCVLAATLLVGIPYNIAFKLIAISGLVLFPAGVWWLGKGLDLRTPGPEIMAIASVFFLVDKDLFSIYGGNIASTMAGEFAFSISITAALFFLGTAARGISTGTHRALGAVLFALVALCHVIPMLFTVGASLVMVIVQPRIRSIGRALAWLLPAGVVGGLISAFWYLPFLGHSAYLNDMGWEKLGVLTCPDKGTNKLVSSPVRREFLRYLFPFAPHQTGCEGTSPSNDPNMWGGKVFFVLAGIGVVLALAFLVRAGVYLTIVSLCCAVAFWLMPQNRFWNARILPFWYLGVYLLAGIGIYMAVRTLWLLVAGRWSDPPLWLSGTLVGGVGAASFVILGLLMHSLPGGVTFTAKTDKDPTYGWACSGGSASGVTPADCLFTAHTFNPVRGWAEWNFRGLELKGKGLAGGATDASDWTEYHAIMQEMARLGQRPGGCGRAYWEYDGDQNRYGSTMAMMLLPYWTDGCIGSMEGLYFEASSTTPFHFLIQSELSAKPSRPMRMDEHVGFTREDPSPYQPVNVEQGVTHLQMLGVRYFLTWSKTVDEAAQREPRLTKVGASGPWTVYEVEASPIVSGLVNLPTVWTDVDDNIHDWVKPSIEWFNDPERWDVLPATSGPPNWPRISHTETDPPRVKAEPVTVSNLKVFRDSMSFDVDQVGTPVLVRVSYFPNWDVEGATGPYRVGPNMMVVVPTSKHVTFSYGYTIWEWLGFLGTLIGIVALVGLAWRERWLVADVARFPGDRVDEPERFRAEMATYGDSTTATSVDPEVIGTLPPPPPPPPPSDQGPPGRPDPGESLLPPLS